MRNCGSQAKTEIGSLQIFEIDEIKEAMQGIKDYCSDRPEVRSIGLIDPAIDSVSRFHR
jgi:hypothetical protein